ncbi:flippase-like domain-containing protein [Candidatus Beckwithbacteria bacterium]|nr:flippase-like domain-containing protein [Candidatus Beckwithbacteria bacterium]
MKNKSWLIHFFSLGLGFFLLFLLIKKIGTNDFWQILKHTSLLWLLIAIATYCSSWFFRTLRLQKFTTFNQGQISFFNLFKLRISGFALNSLLPGKLGDAATIGYLKLHGLKIGPSAAIVFQVRVLDLLSFILLSLPALLLFKDKSNQPLNQLLLVSAIVILIIFAITLTDKHTGFGRWFRLFGKRFSNLKLQKVFDKLADLYESYTAMVAHKRFLIISILLSLLIWFIEGLTAFVVAKAIGSTISLPLLIVALSLANISKIFPITPGGIGIYETVFASSLSFFGIPFDQALMVGIFDHNLKKLFNIVIGIPFTSTTSKKFLKL